MHKPFLFLSAAVLLTAASCSQDKPATDTEVVAVPGTDTTVVVTTPDTAAYRAEADRLAAQITKDLALTDTVVVTKIQKTYYTRGRRLAETSTQYTADTTGQYAAQRAINDATDSAVKTAVTDAQYNTYAANRDTYYDGTPYSAVVVAAPAAAKPARKGPAIVKYDNDGGDIKIEYANGTKVKIDKDGDRKTKYASGKKVKVDDGERKVKP